MEESEAWAQNKPLSVGKALQLLGKLFAKLKKKDAKRREKEFDKAQRLVEEAGRNGGIFAKMAKTFKVKGSKDERVDIEVLSGRAFVPDDDE
ncbi:MAG: hypothetical protein AB8H12_18630 [Lewinella sp.]